jgi:ribosomal protein S27E|tara:strand:+ start:6498 stop:6998 length:501 start_codon:yes stop_codon:yes gene_type:complete
MATRATYYFDGFSFATAIALFTDQALTTKAADGYYSLGSISRRQVNGFLQGAVNCPACGDAISLCYDVTSASEVCCVGCGTTYTGFTSTIMGTFGSVCGNTTFDQTFYHNGSGTIPAMGELVYQDQAGTTPLQNGWYHTNASGTSTRYRITNNTGFVASVEPCGTP